MNYRLVGKLLGVICFLVGMMMLFCLPWAFPVLGHHTHSIVDVNELKLESRGLLALGLSTVICFLVAGLFLFWGRKATGQIFLREAMAIVGLSWILATVLGAPQATARRADHHDVRLVGRDPQPPAAAPDVSRPDPSPATPLDPGPRKLGGSHPGSVGHGRLQGAIGNHPLAVDQGAVAPARRLAWTLFRALFGQIAPPELA